MPDVIGPTLKLGIDASAAKTGAREWTRATDGVKKGGLEASKSTSKLGGEFKKLRTETVAVGRSMSGLAAGLGVTLGFAAIAGSIRSVINEFQEFEKQQLQITALLKTTGNAAGRTFEQIERLAVEIGRETLASVDEVRGAGAQLLTFRSIAGETFDRTLRLAQDLASLGFGNLAGSAVQLAKALEDPVANLSNLRRVGVSFTQQQRDMIKAMVEVGNTAEAQALILDVLEQQVGGAGVAAGGGLAGAFDTLSENIGLYIERAASAAGLTSDLTDLIRTLGDTVGDAADKFTLTGKLSELNTEIQSLQEGLAKPGFFKSFIDIPGHGGVGLDEDTTRLRLDRLKKEREDVLRGLDRQRKEEDSASVASAGVKETLEAARIKAVEKEEREKRSKITRKDDDKTFQRLISRKGPAPESFRAAQDEGLAEGQEKAAALVKTYSDMRETAVDAFNRIREEYAVSNNDMATAVEIRRDRELAALDELKLSEQELAEARVMINEKFDEQLTNTEQSYFDVGKAAADFGFVAVSAFEDAVINGEGFSDILQGLIDDITRMILKMAILGPMMQMLGGSAGGGGGGGLLGSLFGGGGGGSGGGGGGLFGALFGGGGGGGGSGSPLVGTYSAGFTHTGSIVGVDSVPKRVLPQAVFRDAPKLHNGLMPDEFPAVLQRGEGVFTAPQMKALGVSARAAAFHDGGVAGEDTGATLGMRMKAAEFTKPQLKALGFTKPLAEFHAGGIIGSDPGKPRTIDGLPGPSGIAGPSGMGGKGGEGGKGGLAGDDGTAGRGGLSGLAGPGGTGGQGGFGGLAGESGQGGLGGLAGDPGAPGITGASGPGGIGGTGGLAGEPGLAGIGGTAGEAGPGGLGGLAGPAGAGGQGGAPGAPGAAGADGRVLPYATVQQAPPTAPYERVDRFHTGGVVATDTMHTQRVLSTLIERAPRFHDGGIVGVTPTPTQRFTVPMFETAPRFHDGGVAGSSNTKITNVSSQTNTMRFLEFHSGGVVGSDGAPARTVSANTFNQAPRMHSGGIVGMVPMPGRSFSPEVYDAAPRFHGGLAPDESPAILQRGEGVFTSGQMKSLAAPPIINVNVVNNSTGAKTEVEQGNNGDVMIKITDRLANDIESGRLGRSVDKRVKSTYGLTERLVGR